MVQDHSLLVIIDPLSVQSSSRLCHLTNLIGHGGLDDRKPLVSYLTGHLPYNMELTHPQTNPNKAPVVMQQSTTAFEPYGNNTCLIQ
jgi:hypothetical protein